jgi:UDP-N-acetylglucosamine acyltransferase
VKIHPLAHVDPTAVIGEGTTIGPFAVVGPGVHIGVGNEIRSHAVIDGPGTHLGNGNKVFSGAVLGAPPQDKKYHGEPTRLVIGDGNLIREHVTIHRGTPTGGGLTTVGNGNMLLVGCHIAHDCKIGSDIVLSNHVLLAGHVRVEDRAILNGAAAMNQFGTVGTMSYIGGLTRLVRDAPPFMVTEGHPARTVKVNAVGLTRAGVTRERIEILQKAFRHLFRRRHPTLAAAFEALDEEGIESPEIERLKAFLLASSRGRNGRQGEGPHAEGPPTESPR